MPGLVVLAACREAVIVLERDERAFRAATKVSVRAVRALVFMSVLLCQSAYNLFCPNPGTQEMGTIDVIVRTATASIFGYFISANFIRHASKKRIALMTPP